jgi:hypothetical protein
MLWLAGARASGCGMVWYGVDAKAAIIYDECILNEPPSTPLEDPSVTGALNTLRGRSAIDHQ